MTDISNSTTASGERVSPARRTARVSSKKKRLSNGKQRKLVEAAIERLIDLLDGIDVDADDEPSLGWPSGSEWFPQIEPEHHRFMGYDTGDDREGYGASGRDSLLHEGDDEPGCDEEPSLGWTNAVNQTRNQSHDGGWCSEEESSLGWQNEGSQALLTAGTNDEREEQCEDEGAEHDGREPDFPRPPKGYMHPSDLLCPTFPSEGLRKEGQS